MRGAGGAKDLLGMAGTALAAVLLLASAPSRGLAAVRAM
jgi:hypothetical protein